MAHTHVFHSLEEYLEYHKPKNDVQYRYYMKKWKIWNERHPNVPYPEHCQVCSDDKKAAKHGLVKDKKPYHISHPTNQEDYD